MLLDDDALLAATVTEQSQSPNTSGTAKISETQPVAALIAGNRLLAQLRSVENERLAAVARHVTAGEGDVIFSEGGPTGDVWLIVGGMVKMVRFAQLEVALALELRLPGELIGAVFYSDDPRHPCSAVAAERTELLRFPGALLDELLKENPAVTRAFLAEVCRDLCHAQQMRGLSREDVPRRIARALLYLHARFGPEIRQSRTLLAELAGTTVESAIRVTRELSERGIVETGRVRINILSLPGLQQFAQRAAAL